MVKKRKAKKKVTKKKIVTPKDAPPKGGYLIPDTPQGKKFLKQLDRQYGKIHTDIPTAIPVPIVEPEPEEIPTPKPAPCNKCGKITEFSKMVACAKCSALMCITCAGHSPCPRCGV